jgi:hypothetical protein
VHDSAVYQELKDQFYQVREENSRVPDLQLKNYEDVSNWLKIRYEEQPEHDKILKVLKFLNNNYSLGSIPGAHEQDLLTAVWQRAYHPDNVDKFNDIREAIGDAVLDCVEGCSVVCMAGRNAKIWQALARVDNNPKMGIIKSKQVLRNEIYERAAKIVDDHVGQNGSVSDMLKNSYKKSENTEQVIELIECMKDQIEELRIQYKELISDELLNILIEECKSVI